jgi:hypothetical protein
MYIHRQNVGVDIEQRDQNEESKPKPVQAQRRGSYRITTLQQAVSRAHWTATLPKDLDLE